MVQMLAELKYLTLTLTQRNVNGSHMYRKAQWLLLFLTAKVRVLTKTA